MLVLLQSTTKKYAIADSLDALRRSPLWSTGRPSHCLVRAYCYAPLHHENELLDTAAKYLDTDVTIDHVEYLAFCWFALLYVQQHAESNGTKSES